MLIEYKFFEPAFYSTDIPDWGTAYAMCLKLGEQAQVLVDLGHHAQGVNIEQIVAFLLGRGQAGWLPLQQPQVRRRRPDRGQRQPLRALPDLQRAGRRRRWKRRRGHAPPPKTCAYMIDQCHNIEGKMAPMILSVINCQEAYAKALLRAARSSWPSCSRPARCCWPTTCSPMPSAPTCARCWPRCARKWACRSNPIAAYRASGYEEKIRKERGLADASGGFQ